VVVPVTGDKSIRRLKPKLTRLRDNAPDLAARVDEGELSADEAIALLDSREKRSRSAAEEQARRDAEPKPGDLYRSAGLPVPETSADYSAYSRYILAHQPALARSVIEDRSEHDFMFTAAVLTVNERCPWPCDQHAPLSADTEAVFLRAAGAEHAEEAQDVLDWAADLVPGLLGGNQ
jgi:hypothetical protein